MVERQIISKLLVNNDTKLLTDYNIEEKHFTQYLEAFKFISNHYKNYGALPDLSTFYSNIQIDKELISVDESDDYLVSELFKEYKIRCTNKFLNDISEIGSTDIDAALQYAQANIPQIASIGDSEPINIIKSAEDRYNKYIDKVSNPNGYFISTGFQELDDLLGGGWSRDMDFVVLFARTGVGKTILTMQFLQHSFKLGMRTFIVEPEMNEIQIGYRFDTAYKHISSTGLFRGQNLEIDYKQYISDLMKSNVPVYYKAPIHYGLRITPEKIKRDIEKYKIDVMFIDGINYLSPNKYSKNKKRNEELMEISYDLSVISEQLRVPIIVVNQANREGAKEGGKEPELENQSQSDGINFAASRIISITSKQDEFTISLKKNRFGRTGDKLVFNWQPDIGMFNIKTSNSYQVTEENKKEGDIF